MIIPLIGYAPDADPTARGIIVACDKFVPTLRGMKGSAAPASTGVSALGSACLGAATLRDLDNTTRFFAGTSTALYELSVTSWTDRTRSTGAYSVNLNEYWRFAQFGNVALAVTKNNTLQYSDTGAFADVECAPYAAGVEVCGQFVFLWGTNEDTYGDQPDRWWCSAIGDYTDWIPSISTQCVTGQLYGSPGKITGMRRFGTEIIAYKRTSMYRGQYRGSDVVWEFQQIPEVVGALSHESIVPVGTPENPRHLFMGENDFYSWDGSRPIPIGTNRVSETVFGEINKALSGMVVGVHNSYDYTVTWRYPSTGSSVLDKAVVYNYRTDKWGRDDRSCEFAAEFVSSDYTYTDVGTLYSTYADLPSSPYGTAFLQSTYPYHAIFNTSHVLQTLTGASTASSYTTGDLGDDNIEGLVARVKPRFLTAPTSAQMTNYYRQNMGDSISTDQTVTMSASRFDVLRAARWHRFKIDHTGPAEVTAIDLTISEDGDE